MIINNAINSPLPTSLGQGGTGTSLTPSIGGILYSTTSTAAILPGTATADQILLSGSSIIPTIPSWSTATYPATTNVSELLYSSATNVISGLTTATSASLLTNSTGVPAWSGSMSDGQVIIGNATTGLPAAANLMAGIDVTITNAPGSITINLTPSGTPNWQWIATQTASGGFSLNFDDQFSSSYVAYHIVLVNLLLSGTNPQLYLRFGTGSPTPTYVTTNTYIYQVFDVAGGTPDYPGYLGSGINHAQLTWGGGFSGNGVSVDPIYDGISGTIDLFVTSGSSNVANGISNLSYESYNDLSFYTNTTSAFQLPADNFTSVQLITNGGGNTILSGTAYLYGLTT